MVEKHLKIAILTNGNYFANIILKPTICKYRDQIRLVVIVTGDYHGRGGLKSAWSLMRQMALPYFIFKVFAELTIRILSLLSRGKRVVRFGDFLNTLDIKHVFYRNVNDERVRSLLAEAEPDILVSVSCPQKISEDVIGLVKRAAINVHSSLLPKYAGLAPYFWVLSRGERETGTTVHYLTGRFDAGNVLVRRKVPVEPGTSAFELFERLAQAGGGALVEAIEAAAQGRPGEEQRLADRSYRSHPTLRSYLELRRRGHRLMGRADLRRLVAGSGARNEGGAEDRSAGGREGPGIAPR